MGSRDMHAMFELHIEQGPILEAEKKDIGVVTHGQGLRWIECKISGKESHTGSTPMSMRKNAGRGLALITELVHEIAMANQPNAVGAIGHIDVYPNSRNIIPGQVVCTVDMRTHLLNKLNAMVSEFQERHLRSVQISKWTLNVQLSVSLTLLLLMKTVSMRFEVPLKSLVTVTWT